MISRQQTIQQLRANPRVPVLILGGGCNGIALFRELALQGVRCLLVDKADFTAGATSKSSRMIHGGLRYLENREFKLVSESLHERNRLLTNAAHVVFPLKTTIPFFSRLGGAVQSALIFLGFSVRPGSRGSLITNLGLTYYDFVTRKDRRTPTHFLMPRDKALQALPGLNPEIIGTATYWDAMITEAERLCIELIHDAQRASPDCAALNYVVPQRLDGNHVSLKDLVTGETLLVEPQFVVNATGAWVDAANAILGEPTDFIGGTKGSHLVVDCPDLYNAIGDQMVYYQHADGRVCIVFRFLDKVIMGSTDIPVDDPDKATFDDREIEYMLVTLQGVFPGVKVNREHIVFAFCGVRPLPSTKSTVTANISRGHTIHFLEPAGARQVPIVCLIGGKWTTFRALAEQTADKLLSRLGLTRRVSTAGIPIGGGKDFPVADGDRAQWIARVSEKTKCTPQRTATLLGRYGTVAETIAATDNTPLESLPEYSAGEIEWMAANDAMVHLADLVYRRSTIGLLGNATIKTLTELAAVAGRILGWDKERQMIEVTRALPPQVRGAPRTGAQKAAPSDWTRIMHVMRSSNTPGENKP
ncbi:MAG: glycerol-3-phosphate dehydrogenase/oxidase [Verrucomicrobia bacterium]|nr:glycerol-3-phosphate dehydrogenase/oxidase [Verrucomicrobiota bacterium]